MQPDVTQDPQQQHVPSDLTATLLPERTARGTRHTSGLPFTHNSDLTSRLLLCHPSGMYEQHRIPATLSNPETLARVKALIAAAGSASRMEIGRRVCQLLGFLDARGQPQLASCLQALRTLDAAGRIRVPAPRHNHRRCCPHCLGRPVPPPVGVPARADQLRGLELVAVTDSAQRRVWNELMRSEHPRGAVQHPGAQLRYLLVSDHGVLGALGFAAAALALAARDACIDWGLLAPALSVEHPPAYHAIPSVHEIIATPKSFPGAAQNDQAAVRGYYRLIDQPADSEVRPENILAPHRERTLQRMQGQAAVLCIQDRTDLNFAEHPGCVGLGLIGKNKGSAGTLGLHMHSTLVVNGEGVPLGVPQIQYGAPDGQAERGNPLEQRQTMRWIRGLRECAELGGQMEGVRPVSVMDREADVFALFGSSGDCGRWTCWCGRSTTVRWGRTCRSCSTGSGGRRRRDGCRSTWRGRSGWRRWSCAGAKWNWRTRTGRRRRCSCA